ncbi:MAG: hypothetical protein GX651_07030 [Methanomicrobiales archaeon]|nr:hypothetical protein [Methanomicrobiales archaeon]
MMTMVNADLLSVLVVGTLGLFFGTVLGLLIGHLANQQRGDLNALSIREKRINATLVIGCSAICIAIFAAYAFR